MRYLPRFAVGTIQPAARRESMVWALLGALNMLEDSPVLFRSSCGYSAHDPSRTVLGRPSRHLDSWAMSRSDAICALASAMRDHDTALVEGEFDSALPALGRGIVTSRLVPAPTPIHEPRSSLDTLCDWLDLPRLAIVDVVELAARGFAHPPTQFDAILLDRVVDARDAAYWQTTLEALWKTPVLGWLDEATSLRSLGAALTAGTNPSRELCDALAKRLLPTLRLQRLRALARRAVPLVADSSEWLCPASEGRFRIAVAYDQAYCGYYPETLDLLEGAGAELCDFSPLRSESIPEGADVVYFGCGHPERDPEALARNHCLKQSLRSFAARGGRIYAEGSGLAYLCRDMVFPCGRTIPMTGLLPATARWLSDACRPEPTEIVFGASSWLVPADVSLRGYRHTGWQIEPRGPMITYARDPSQRLDVLGRGTVIGSRILVNLAANRHLLRRFFEPYVPLASRRES